MTDVFLTVLNMSVTAAFVIVALCIARLVLRKIRAPKWVSYALWAVAGFRLAVPVAFESVMSLIPRGIPEVTAPVSMYPEGIPSGTVAVPPEAISLQPGSTEWMWQTASPYADVPQANPVWSAFDTLAVIWLVGIAAMVVYSVISYILLLRRKDSVATPFIYGFIKPKIHIPCGLEGDEFRYAMLHEQTHIKRRDYIIKLLAFALLCIHWFNPLAWVAFVLLCADMEMSCDERVLRELGMDAKADYSQTLLSLSANRRIMNASPLAFGEGGIKERVKNVLKFKKPSRVIITVAVALVVVLSVGLALNQAAGAPPIDMDAADNMGEAIPPEERTPPEPRTGPISLGSYSTDDNLVNVTLLNGGEFRIIFLAVSYAPSGNFTISGDRLILNYADGEQIFIHRGGSLEFVSGEWLENVIEPGTVLTLTERWDPESQEPTVPVGVDDMTERYPGILDKVYLGMPRSEVRELFGEPHFMGSGLDFWNYADVGVFYFGSAFSGDIYAHDYEEAFVRDISITEDRYWSVNGLINAAVIERNSGSFYEPDGVYPAQSHVILALDADIHGFTAYVVSLYLNYMPDGEYDVREVGGTHTPLALTFSKNANGDYVLTEYWEPENGMGYLASIRSKFPRETWESADTQLHIGWSKQNCYHQAMYHFVGEVPLDGRYGIGYHNPWSVALTNTVTNYAAMEGSNDDVGFLISYFPGATLQIEAYDESNDDLGYGPGSWVIEYADQSKNITVGREGTGVIPITDDLIGIYDTDGGRYAMRFEKYVKAG